ncbi:MAG: preQ(1) synthase [Candidatus Omnitrophica bacterium]|nr:preQ(1) synthase [Candidatus Omnitrophota bacterium]MCF7877903.1 preQ(1) synthase [Candidatus Omnitrophota bacterium]MCF7893087.1 preQ(1) synthase [Candidatus Omnitrophota bacterium]
MIFKERKISSLEKKAKKTASKSFLPKDIDSSILETIAYQYPKNEIDVQLASEEFSCVCPYSGLPDFACLTIRYTPDKKLVELKSLKYYLYAFRNVKVYNEHAVNKILEDLKKALKPKSLDVTAEFTVRGGIKNKVAASFRKS